MNTLRAFLILSIFVSYSLSYAAAIGQDAYLVTPMFHPHIAVDESALDEYVKAAASNDLTYGVRDLYGRGKLFQTDDKVRVRVLDKGFGKVKIRILDGTERGRSGWVVSEWVADQLPKRERFAIPLPQNCSQVKIANALPSNVPKGFKGQKTKYRVVSTGDAGFAIYDTNKITKPSNCQVKVYPPAHVQLYFFQDDNWTGVAKKWMPDILDAGALTLEPVAIIERH